MTTISEAREQVYQTWVDNVPSGLDSWTFENEEGFVEPDQDKTWARVLMRSVGGGQETLGSTGNRKFRRQALIIVEVFTPRGRGLGTGDDLAQEILSIYEARSIGGLDLTDGTITEVPSTVESKSIQHLVQVLFDYEEKK